MTKRQSSVFNPFAGDFAYLFLLRGASGLQGALSRFGLGFKTEVLVALTVGLGWGAPLAALAVATGNVSPDEESRRVTLSEDTWGIALFFVFPFTVAMGYNFYSSIEAKFRKLACLHVLSGDIARWMNEIEANLNGRMPSAISLAIGVTISIAILFSGGRHSWFEDYFLIHTYMFIWSILALSAMAMFAWKANRLWRCISNHLHSPGDAVSEIALRVDLFHADGCGGLSTLTWMWLRAHLVVVMVGIHTVVWILVFNPGTLGVLGLTIYLIAGPILFIGPFLSAHLRLQHQKLDHLEALHSVLKEARESGDMEQQMQTITVMRYVESLSEWPFSVDLTERFLASYVLPFLVLAVGLVLENGSLT